jgi:hypothetical protein
MIEWEYSESCGGLVHRGALDRRRLVNTASAGQE